MPKIQKQFNLEITVEQFLNSCSYLELQEVDLRLDVYLKKAEHDAYRNGTDPEEKPSAEETKEIGFDEEF